jgi:hypothetical protein
MFKRSQRRLSWQNQQPTLTCDHEDIDEMRRAQLSHMCAQVDALLKRSAQLAAEHKALLDELDRLFSNIERVCEQLDQTTKQVYMSRLRT